MRYEPHQLSDGLKRMLAKAGRHDLIESGFDIHDDTLASSHGARLHGDHAIYHALFDRSAPHYPAVAPKIEEPKIQNEDAPAAPVTPPVIIFPDQPSNLVHWIQTGILLLILIALLAGHARAQGTPNGGPTSPLVIQLQSGGVTLGTRSVGLLKLNCSTATFANNVWTCTAGGGGGSGTVTSIATTSPISGGTITTTGTISCPTCGVTSSPLSQFAATTSAQFLATITDPTGTGSNVFAVSPALVTPTIATSAALTNSSLGTTPAGGYGLTNSTAAAAGAQQVSPPIVWTGQGWKTTATAASQSVAFQAYVLPVQGAANPTVEWRLDSNINSLGSLNVLRVVSSTATNGAQVLINGQNVAGFGAQGSGTLDLYVSGGVSQQVTNTGFYAAKSTGGYMWTSGTTLSGNPTGDTFLTRFAAATLQHGNADAAAPVAQAIRFQSVVAGTSNANGADATIKASAGTGTGIGGSINLQTCPAGSTGTAQNPCSTALSVTPTLITLNLSPKFGGTNSTGAGSAALGANSPATTLTAPYTWITVITSDGSTGYIPVWK